MIRSDETEQLYHCQLATQPAGFSFSALAETVRARTGWVPKMYSARQAACGLAKLRGKKLARRKDKSR
jgi:hypothetical protein